MRLIFGKAHVKGHYRTDPTTHAQVYVKPHEDGREAGHFVARPALPGERYSFTLDGELFTGSGKNMGSVNTNGRQWRATAFWGASSEQAKQLDGRRFDDEASAREALLVYAEQALNTSLEDGAKAEAGQWDSAAFYRREKTIRDAVKASKASVVTHLDQLPFSVEAMRGVRIRSLRNGSTGVVTAATSFGDTNVQWDDEASANENGGNSERVEVGTKQNPRIVTEYHSRLGKSDLDEFVVMGDKAVVKKGHVVQPTVTISIPESARSIFEVEAIRSIEKDDYPDDPKLVMGMRALAEAWNKNQLIVPPARAEDMAHAVTYLSNLYDGHAEDKSHDPSERRMDRVASNGLATVASKLLRLKHSDTPKGKPVPRVRMQFESKESPAQEKLQVSKFQGILSLASDSPAQLRESDVDRVMSEASADEREPLRKWLLAQDLTERTQAEVRAWSPDPAAVDPRDFSKELQELQKQLTETKSVKEKLRLLDHGIEITTEFIENAKVHGTVTPQRLGFYQDWLGGIQENRDRLAAATVKQEQGQGQMSLFKALRSKLALWFRKTLTSPQTVSVHGGPRRLRSGQVAFVGPHAAIRHKRVKDFAPIGTSTDVSMDEMKQAVARAEKHWPDDYQAVRMEVLSHPHVYKVWQKMNGDKYTQHHIERAHNEKYGHGFVYFKTFQGTRMPWNSVKDEYFSHAPGTAWNGVGRESKHRFIDELVTMAHGADPGDENISQAMHYGLKVVRSREIPAGFKVGDRLERADGSIVSVVGGQDGYLITEGEDGKRAQLSPRAIERGTTIRLPDVTKSHVKTYTRSDGVVVREHNDKRRSGQPDEKHPRGPAKEKGKKGRRKAEEEEPPKPDTTAQPEYPKVEPPEEGELAAWIEQIMQEPDILAAMEEVDGTTPTDKIYKTETGEYQPDRAKLHQSIVASMLNPRAVPEEGQRPHAVIFMGRPASGKTTALGPAAKELGVEFTVINADDVKEKLPEYNRRNAGVVHEESSDIAEGQLLPQALDAGHHLLLDITGANVGKVRKLVETFHQLGYEISVMMADLPIEKAVARAVNRFRNPGNGRFVPPRYIVENVDHKPEKTYDAMKSDPRVAHWRRYNNDVEAGEKAPLKDQGSKDVAGNPFHKGGQFDANGDFFGSEGLQSFRGDGREPERPHASRARQSSEEVQGHATGPVDPSLLRAYEVRDTLTKSIHHLNIDLDSPEIAADVRGTLLSQRLGHHTRLERLNDLIEKAEYATC